ncbi:MAG: hypothetical protein AAGE18_05740 [Pseudomonadota bacterium]
MGRGRAPLQAAWPLALLAACSAPTPAGLELGPEEGAITLWAAVGDQVCRDAELTFSGRAGAPTVRFRYDANRQGAVPAEVAIQPIPAGQYRLDEVTCNPNDPDRILRYSEAAFPEDSRLRLLFEIGAGEIVDFGVIRIAPTEGSADVPLAVNRGSAMATAVPSPPRRLGELVASAQTIGTITPRTPRRGS